MKMLFIPLLPKIIPMKFERILNCHPYPVNSGVVNKSPILLKIFTIELVILFVFFFYLKANIHSY